jgi:hypothetical protein
MTSVEVPVEPGYASGARVSHRGCSPPAGPPSSAGPPSRPGVGPHRRGSALSGTGSHGTPRRRTFDCRQVGRDLVLGPGTGLLGTRSNDRRAEEKPDPDADDEPRHDTDAYPTGCAHGSSAFRSSSSVQHVDVRRDGRCSRWNPPPADTLWITAHVESVPHGSPRTAGDRPWRGGRSGDGNRERNLLSHY